MACSSYIFAGERYTSPSEIIPGLYLGGVKDAKEKSGLKRIGVTVILNITYEIKNYFPNDFKYFNINVLDESTTSIVNYADESYKIISEALKASQKVFVHCAAGRSRSASIVVLFIMRYKKMNLKEAFKFVQRKRPIIYPNESFRLQLAKYEYLKTGVCSIMNEVDDLWNFPDMKSWKQTIIKPMFVM